MAMAVNYNSTVYPAGFIGDPLESDRWFTCWNAYATRQKLLERERLLPEARLPTTIEPFTYEVSNPIGISDEQLLHGIKRLGKWDYQMEFRGSVVSTRGERHERDWKYHRYRGSLLVRNLAELLGDNLSKLSVLDIGCHCGPFSLEFAQLGAGRVLGLDLRTENIDKGRWLAETYGIRNVEFKVENARNLRSYRGFDIVFCGGLLYHLTFPIDFLATVFECCDDFLVFDTLTHKEPISAFHLVQYKDVSYSAEGETHYELHPTYRAVVDCLRSTGFEDVIELVGSDASDVSLYQDGLTRSFIASKHASKSWSGLKDNLGAIS